MKINEHGQIHLLQAYQKTGAPAKAEQTKNRGDSHDQVSISPEAWRLAQAVRAKTDDLQRSQKLEQIKLAVQNGTYEVDAWKIADKMIRYLSGE